MVSEKEDTIPENLEIPFTQMPQPKRFSPPKDNSIFTLPKP